MGVEAKSKEREELCSQEPWNPTTRPHMRLGAEGSRVLERCPACPGLFVHQSARGQPQDRGQLLSM